MRSTVRLASAHSVRVVIRHRVNDNLLRTVGVVTSYIINGTDRHVPGLGPDFSGGIEQQSVK